MKADWDDAPQHLKQSNRPQELGKWLVAAALGVGMTALAMYFGGVQVPLFQPKPPAAQTSPTDNYTPAFEFDEPVTQPEKTPEQLFWDDVNAQNRQQAQQKQTDYNDNNYVPKGAANVVSMEGVRQSGAYRNPTRRESASTNNSIEHDGYWIDKWSGGAKYYAEWTAINNYIDGTSVCENHKRGSIDYRECRKGAKQLFKEQCQAWSARSQSNRKSWSNRMKLSYCSAASSFSPMG